MIIGFTRLFCDYFPGIIYFPETINLIRKMENS